MALLQKKLDLWLLRHAKSSWSDPALPDIDRPLNNRGRNAAVTVSKFLNQLGFTADLALCSPSRRTQTTLNILNCNLVTPVPKQVLKASLKFCPMYPSLMKAFYWWAIIPVCKIWRYIYADMRMEIQKKMLKKFISLFQLAAWSILHSQRVNGAI